MKVLSRFTLLVLLIVAGVLRLSHLNWDQFQHVHPDERFIVWVADSISAPGDLASALDPARSTINPFRWPPGAGDLAGKPRSYAYGHFPLYLLVIVAHAAQAVGRWFGETTLVFPPAFQPLYTIGRHLAEYNYLALVGRVISALCDLGTLVLVYVLAQQGMGVVHTARAPATALVTSATVNEKAGSDSIRPYNPAISGAGLLAACAYAFAVLPIQLSHFYAVDMVLTFCTVAAMALAARWAQTAHCRDLIPNTQYPIPNLITWLLAGLMTGLAIGSKFSAVLLIVPLAVAACYGLPAGDWARKVVIVLGRLAVVATAALFTFILTNPFAVIEIGAYVLNILAQNAMVSGVMDAPYTRQYIGTAPYWYFIRQLSQWGLGWPLGIVAWGGFVWAIGRAARRQASPALVVMLAWALPYFAITGAFHAKFLRYMAPLLPFLLVFGAGAAVELYRRLKMRWGRPGQVAWVVAAAAVGIFTAGWALAFTGVYRQEHPWIQASRWIYENVPAQSKLLTEHWDDALPLALDELPGRPQPRAYVRVELPLYDPDTPAKLDTLAAELSSADYVIIASNRLYAPIQRLPGRYPMTSHYYQMLFGGQLGYQQVAEFTAYPRLELPFLGLDTAPWRGSSIPWRGSSTFSHSTSSGRGLVIPDDHADESFTVYDHPRAIIFANTGRLSESRLRARLARYLPTGSFHSPFLAVRNRVNHCKACLRRLDLVAAGRSRSIPVGLRNGCSDFESPEGVGGAIFRTANQHRPPGHAAYRRTPSSQEEVPQTASMEGSPQVAVADFRWNKFASEWPPAAVVLWWLGLSLFGWLAWPLLFPLLRGLADRGYGLARVAGWLLVGWVHWLAVSLGLWQNRVGPLAAVLAALAVAGLTAWWLRRRQIAAFWAGRHRLLLAEEALFALAFLAFVGLRLLNPDLWQPWNGGEKFMEFAFLNATLRSPHFPPYDPYFAGGTLNYYYFGLYLVGTMIKLTGIVPEVAFNLAVPGLFALTALGVFSVGYTLAGEPRGGGAHSGEQGSGGRGAQGRRGVSAILAVVLTLLMGNLAGLGELLREVVVIGGGTLDYDRPLAHFFGPLATGVAMIARGVAKPAYDFWAASRVIPNTINEFPFWTFLFADLHPHLIAMPLGMLVVGLALNWVLGMRDWKLGNGFLLPLAFCLLLSLSLGALGATNTWDLPVYFVLVAAAFLVAGVGNFPGLVRPGRGRADAHVATGDSAKPPCGTTDENGRADAIRPYKSGIFRTVAGALLAAGLVGALAVAAYCPFYAHYQARVGESDGPLFGRFLAPVRAASPLGPWLVVWGFFLFLAFSFVVVEVWRQRRVDAYAAAGTPADEIPHVPDTPARPAEPGQAPEVPGTPGVFGVELLAQDEGDERTEEQESERVEGRRSLVPLSIYVLILAGITLILFALARPTAGLLVIPLGLAVRLIFRSASRWSRYAPLLDQRDSLPPDRPPSSRWSRYAPLLDQRDSQTWEAGGPVGPEGREIPTADPFLFLLLALGLGIVAGTELFYLRDFLEGSEWYRMNTLFKFGISAWLFLGLAGGVMLPRAWAAFGRRPAWLRVPWQVVAVLLLAAGLAFLPLGIPSRLRDRFPGPRPAIGTLDGTAYMTVGRYSWPDPEHPIELAYDYLAIHWLLDHVTGTPVVAEAPAGSYQVTGAEVGYDYYRAGGLRVASLTGFPTFLGQHQFEQRPAAQVWPRAEEGQEFFRTTDIARARELMRDLNVGYVYVGTLERFLFPEDGLRKFDMMVELGDLEVAYRNAQVTVYRVPDN